MDKKRTIINVTIGIIFQTLLLILAVVSKSFVVRFLGDEANGLYSLYISILGFFDIANLGLGTAIVFSLYKPIVEKDRDVISALYYLYKRFYLIVFFIILVAGTVLTPFVPTFAKNNTGQINIYTTYFVFLISVVITYLYAHKISLINAYKDNYITTLISSSSLIIGNILQIIVIAVTQNFLYFLLVRILIFSIEGIITRIVFNRKYSKHISGNKNISEELRREVFKNSKAMFFYKVGGNLISTFDGIIISSFVGIVALGYYSNYIIIVTGLTTLLNLLFSEINSIIGHLYVENDKTVYYNEFKRAYLINFVVGFIFYFGFIAICDELVAIIFGSGKIVENILVLIIGINYFVSFQRRSITLFKTASGGFYNDRFRPFIEGLCNIVLSIVLVYKFAEPGVLIATIFSRLIITYSYEPYVLFSVSFEKKSKKFQFIHYLTVLMFTIIVILYSFIPIPKMSNYFLDIIVKGTLSVFISLVSIALIYITFKPFRNTLNDLIRIAVALIKRKRKTA